MMMNSQIYCHLESWKVSLADFRDLAPQNYKSRGGKKTIILWTYLWGSMLAFRKGSILDLLHLNQQLHKHQSMAQV